MLDGRFPSHDQLRQHQHSLHRIGLTQRRTVGLMQQQRIFGVGAVAQGNEARQQHGFLARAFGQQGGKTFHRPSGRQKKGRGTHRQRIIERMKPVDQLT